MPATAQHKQSINPLDQLERIAEARSWRLDRTNDHEVVMLVGGGWVDLNMSLTWSEDIESLHFACALDAKVPARRHTEMVKLIAQINAQLVHGHFDIWADGSLVYRYTLLLAGGAHATDEQCETLVRLAVETTQAYYPAINFVIWAGQSADEALKNAMLETVGEA